MEYRSLLAASILGALGAEGCAYCRPDKEHLDMLCAKQAETKNEKDRELFDEIIHHNEKGNYRKAVFLLENKLKLEPGHEMYNFFCTEMCVAWFNSADQDEFMHDAFPHDSYGASASLEFAQALRCFNDVARLQPEDARIQSYLRQSKFRLFSIRQDQRDFYRRLGFR